MADLIDRQTAIEIAIEAADEWDGGTSFSRNGIIERRFKMIPAVHVADISKKADGDCISRQAAIDALDVLCQEHRYKIPGKRETYGQYNEAWQDALDRAEGAIFNLPTVQPDHVAESNKKDEQPAEIAQNVQNGDLIQREAAIEALARMMPRSYTPDGSHPADEEIFRAQEVFVDCIEALEILPSVQPEIVKCKDCKYNVSSHKCLHPESFFLVPDDNFYCGYAERRTDG